MPLQRIIKKYPNRRLYDMERCRYINLTDIRKLVLQRERFKVVDHKSRADVTRVVLLQVLLEREQAGKSMVTRAFLDRTIRRGA